MKICIYGAGAIGGLLGGRLCAAGHDVTLIARGRHLDVLRAEGLRLSDRGDEIHVHPHCTDDPETAGPQDYVVLTMKAHGVPDAARRIEPLFGPDTAVVSTQNGLPWWYFNDTGGPADGRRLLSVDPMTDIGDAIASRRIIGGVANAAASVPEPGVIRCIAGGLFIVGEIDGGPSDRVTTFADAVTNSGLSGRATERIRDEIWTKLWGNVSFSAIAVLTGSPMAPMVEDPALRSLAAEVMVEAQDVAEALGVSFPITIDQRIEGSAKMGAHKTSILQDLEAERPMEVDAMIGSVVEAGRIAGVATPLTGMLYALVKRRARQSGCYPENPALDAFLGIG